MLTVSASPFWFVVAILAAWRVTRLIAREDGPWRLMVAVRRTCYRLRLAGLIECVHCLGMWTSVAITSLMFPLRWSSVWMWLGIAGGVSLLLRLSDHESPPHEEED